MKPAQLVYLKTTINTTSLQYTETNCNNFFFAKAKELHFFKIKQRSLISGTCTQAKDKHKALLKIRHHTGIIVGKRNSTMGYLVSALCQEKHWHRSFLKKMLFRLLMKSIRFINMDNHLGNLDTHCA